MYQYQHKNKQKGQQLTDPGRFSEKQETDPEWKLKDSRPEALVQQKLQAAANESPQAKESAGFQVMADSQQNQVQQQVAQLMRKPKKEKKGTVSGHGGLRRDPKTGKLVKYKVPRGKTIVITAPPGATLGDISLILNTSDDPDFKQIRKMVKISTTKDLWKNKQVITRVRVNNNIVKTSLQMQLLEDLDTAKRSYDDLTGSEKGSLTRLEGKSEFEQWAESYVSPEMFQVKKGGQTMNDMSLEPFEDKLRSPDDVTSDQNDYIEQDTFLSEYMKDHSDLTQVTINACSDDPESPFSGFQIDKK